VCKYLDSMCTDLNDVLLPETKTGDAGATAGNMNVAQDPAVSIASKNQNLEQEKY
jgi:hypothetical protein